MKRLLLLTAALGMLMLAASPAMAQDDLDCGDFNSQAEAQAELRSDPSDPNGLDAESDGVACETTAYDDPARDEVPVTAAQSPTGDADCEDFATQEDAQAVFNADPSDPSGLDADGDGLACEDALPSGETGEMMEEPTAPVSCDGFASQFGAQQFFDFNATPEEQAILDPDGNGFACDDGTIEFGVDPTEAPVTEQYVEEEPMLLEAAGDLPAPAASQTMTALPDTGGASLIALGAGALLVAGGLLIRRR